MQGFINPDHNPFDELIITNGFEASNLEISILKNGINERIPFPYLDGEGIWQKRKLAYEIDTFKEGIYTITTFELPCGTYQRHRCR